MTFKRLSDIDIDRANHSTVRALLRHYEDDIEALENQKEGLVASLRQLKLDLEHNGEVFKTDERRLQEINSSLKRNA